MMTNCFSADNFRFGKAKKEEKIKATEAGKEQNKQQQSAKIYDKPPRRETKGGTLEEKVVRLESPTVIYLANSL